MKDDVAYEQGDRKWRACVPDLPGVAVAGASREGCHDLIVEAIRDRGRGWPYNGWPILREPQDDIRRASG
jgi:hypothetical protein